MARAEDVIHELTSLHTAIAKALDDAPTGVTPGYSSALGGAVMPNGKLRYVASGVSTGGTASFYRATNQSFTSGAFAQLIFTGTQWVDASLYTLNTSTGVVTFSTTGHYLIIARIQWASNATGRRIIEVNQHGSSTPLIANDIKAAITSSDTPVTAMGFADIIAGDTVDVNGYQNSGGNLNASSGLGYGAFHIQQIG